jgi:hypothetical protein
MADYCSSSDVKAEMPDSSLASSTDATYDTAIGTLITAVSRLIDKQVGREPNWFASTDSETRYYDGSGEVTQEIDECHTLTSVAVSESGSIVNSEYTAWTLDTDYYVSPYNYSALGLPIDRLIADWNGTKYKFPRYRKAVKVVAQFGYSATPPDDIKQACIIQSMRWFGRAKQMFQDQGGGDWAGQTVFARSELDPDVKIILQSYKLGNMV